MIFQAGAIDFLVFASISHVSLEERIFPVGSEIIIVGHLIVEVRE